MVAGPALRVGRASEELADGGAAKDAEGIGATHLVLAALLVRGAGGYRGDFALTTDWVPYMRRRALAHWPVILNAAGLVFATAHDPAGVHTAPFSADVDTADTATGTVLLCLTAVFLRAAQRKVLWVAREAVLTDAGAVVVVGDTAGVGAALHITTGIHTAVLALHRLADLVVATVEVVGASRRLAALSWVLSITLEAGQA